MGNFRQKIAITRFLTTNHTNIQEKETLCPLWEISGDKLLLPRFSAQELQEMKQKHNDFSLFAHKFKTDKALGYRLGVQNFQFGIPDKSFSLNKMKVRHKSADANCLINIPFICHNKKTELLKAV